MNLNQGDIIAAHGVVARDWREAGIKQVKVSSINRDLNQVVVAITSEHGHIVRGETWNYAHVVSAVRRGDYSIVPGNNIDAVEALRLAREAIQELQKQIEMHAKLQITEQANGKFSVYTDTDARSMADERLLAFDLELQRTRNVMEIPTDTVERVVDALNALIGVANEGADEIARIVHPDKINKSLDDAQAALRELATLVSAQT